MAGPGAGVLIVVKWYRFNLFLIEKATSNQISCDGVCVKWWCVTLCRLPFQLDPFFLLIF